MRKSKWKHNYLGLGGSSRNIKFGRIIVQSKDCQSRIGELDAGTNKKLRSDQYGKAIRKDDFLLKVRKEYLREKQNHMKPKQVQTSCRYFLPHITRFRHEVADINTYPIHEIFKVKKNDNVIQALNHLSSIKDDLHSNTSNL